MLILFFSHNTFARKLEIVTLHYPPYIYVENAEIKGVVVEIIKEVFNRMHQPINISVLPWARAIKRIKNGKEDAIFSIYKTKEREIFADFSQEILIMQTVSLYVRKDSHIEFNGDINTLSRYRVGAVRQVSYGKAFDLAVKNKALPSLVLVNIGLQNFQMLLADRVDIVVSNKHGASTILKSISGSDKVRELTNILHSIPSYIAFSKKRNHIQLINKFDSILKVMKKDGSYNSIINKYFESLN